MQIAVFGVGGTAVKTPLRRLRNESGRGRRRLGGGYLMCMTQDLIGAILSAGVLAYLVYALINPEKF